MNKKSIIFSLMLFLIVVSSRSEIKFASILGDNMVLQRNTQVNLWGKSNPNEKLTVTVGWDQKKYTATASATGEWLIKVPTKEAGGPYTITVSSVKEKKSLKNILLGEVWLCSGQSNMEMPLAGFGDQPTLNSNDLIGNANQSNIRLITLKRTSIAQPQDTCVGKWSETNPENAANFSAVAYLYALYLQKQLNVPIGLISSNWGGSRIEAWMSKEVINEYPAALSQTTLASTPLNHKASQLYNGMIAPLINYTIKGAIWYQGESNIVNYTMYADLMAGMVKGWRKDFKVGDFPFYFVQIAPYNYGDSNNPKSALQRDAQLKAASLIPNSGMISTLDIGEEKCIHPAQKELVGKRLANYSLAQTYNLKGVHYKSPVYKSFSVKDSMIVLTFENSANGLTSFGKKMQCFEVAGSDKVFYPATAKISQRQVQLVSDKVKAPVAARYAYKNYPTTEGYLFNIAGLPVPSFRTDDWEIIVK